MISAVIPTLGRSPHLEDCLRALRREGREGLEVLVVAQGFDPEPAVADLADRVLRLPANAGFARANNLAFAEARGDLLATVNDDAVVGEGWLGTLAGALAEHPEAAAAQGWNLDFGDPPRIDGGGLAWNRALQAVQIGHGEPWAAGRDAAAAARIFGVSATAALYRREALETVGGPRFEVFDERLFAYYEDVELAVRLRAAGHDALRVSGARCRHAGSRTGRELGAARWRLLYGNRHLVLARCLGRAFWQCWPRILGRDLADLARAASRGEAARAAGIVGGLGRFLRHGRRYVHRGPPAVPTADLRPVDPAGAEPSGGEIR